MRTYEVLLGHMWIYLRIRTLGPRVPYVLVFVFLVSFSNDRLATQRAVQLLTINFISFSLSSREKKKLTVSAAIFFPICETI